MMSNQAAYLLANPNVNWRLSRAQLSRAQETETGLYQWAEKHGFTVTRRKHGGWLVKFHKRVAAEPKPPKEGTPIAQLHHGNRLRLMSGQPLLPENAHE